MKASINDIVARNIADAIDQSGDYDNQLHTTSICKWFEGDAYCRNTFDTCKEAGFSDKEAADAANSFCVDADGTSIRFA